MISVQADPAPWDTLALDYQTEKLLSLPGGRRAWQRDGP